MSHQSLREEKNCLNCGENVEERFCTHCGQENIQLKDSFIHLVIHYFQDLVHYDGKLWQTMKSLVISPGKVQKEFLAGRRKAYLDPIRFYVFSSTVFFLLFFVLVGKVKFFDNTPPKYNTAKRLHGLRQELEFAKGSTDTTYVALLIKSVQHLEDSLDRLENDTLRPQTTLDLFDTSDTLVQNDSWLNNLFERRRYERARELGLSEGGDIYKGMSDFINDLFHRLPQIFFLSLPFLALFLKLLYIRSRRTYVEHFIFSIYGYSFVFVLLILVLLLWWVAGKIDAPFFYSVRNIITWLSVCYLFAHFFLSMRRFYNDSTMKLIIKYFILSWLMFFLFILLSLLIAVVIFIL